MSRRAFILWLAATVIGCIFSCKAISLAEEAMWTTVVYLGNPKTTLVKAVVAGQRTVKRQHYVTYRFAAYLPGIGIQYFTNEDIVNLDLQRIGSSVEVDYLPDRPSISEITGTDPELHENYLDERFTSPFIFHCILGTLLFFPGLFAVMSAIFSASRSHRQSVRE